MASPSYVRSCFGAAKRIKFSPTAPVAPRMQRAMATVNESRPLDSATSKALQDLPVPLPVRLAYLRPLRRQPTHGLPVCNLQLRSYTPRNLDFFADFAMRAAYYLKLPARGPVPLPRIIERWTVPRGNFAHKKSQENFERRTCRRLIQIQDGDPETVQLWLAYLEKRGYHGVGMKANLWEYEGLDAIKDMDAEGADVGELLSGEFERQPSLEQDEEQGQNALHTTDVGDGKVA